MLCIVSKDGWRTFQEGEEVVHDAPQLADSEQRYVVIADTLEEQRQTLEREQYQLIPHTYTS